MLQSIVQDKARQDVPDPAVWVVGRLQLVPIDLEEFLHFGPVEPDGSRNVGALRLPDGEVGMAPEESAMPVSSSHFGFVVEHVWTVELHSEVVCEMPYVVVKR